jgi:hypothetical protein
MFPTITTSVQPTAHSAAYRTLRPCAVDTTIASGNSCSRRRLRFHGVTGGFKVERGIVKW